MANKYKPFAVSAFKKRLGDLGQRVKMARQAKGMTQTELADLLSISSKTISAIEVGRIEASISQMQGIAAVLEEPIGYFTGESASSVESKIERVSQELEEIRKLMNLAEMKQ